MKQSKEQLEEFYKTLDPWKFRTTQDDVTRREKILSAIPQKKYKKTLDIGCGEGFITEKLPGDKIYGYDVSDIAMSRLNKPVEALERGKIRGKYDLIVATGVMYQEYDLDDFKAIIDKHASGTVVTSNMKDVEVEILDPKKLKSVEEFPYRSGTQVLRVYDYGSVSTSRPRKRATRKKK